MKFYLTTPLYYANAEPHIGHAYTTIIADIITRFHRIAGYDVMFLTGTDEHGQKVDESAQKRGKTPIEHCDEIVLKFKDVWKILNIQYDDFIRTTEDRHIKVVQNCLQKLYDKGDIYKSDYEGWYCIPDERYWTEKELEDNKCPHCGRDVIKITESNYFFKMSKYQDWLINWIDTHPDFVRPNFRKNEVLGFLKNQLNDLCISRPKGRLKWGIEIPFDKDFVCYVWVDALINYISAIGYSVDEKKFNYYWPADCHLMAKDILTIHSVYWTILLKALDIEPPKMIFAHGYWTIKDMKMGKSMGNAISPVELVNTFGVDPIRYYLTREMSFGYDSTFSYDLIKNRIESELSDDIGNLFQRTVSMVHKYLNGVIPENKIIGKEENDLQEFTNKQIIEFEKLILDFEISKALEYSISIARETNKFIEQTAPWTLNKKGDKERLNSVLYTALEILRKISIIYYPIMPSKCEDMRKILNATEPLSFKSAKEWGLLNSGSKLGEPIPLFPKIEDKPVVEEKKEQPKIEEYITIDDFKKVQLRVGIIKEAEMVTGAKKLLKLKVDIGTEIRQLVAGLGEYYKPEEMVGKRIVIVTNLKPAVIRGVESQGMLLAGEKDGIVSLLTTDKDILPGATIS